ncbi:MAG: hypothetical protein Ct9H300mP20_13820 [Gammaproteobacteria bacterium]|nr:MAG: hypothetical protein Ct9H300mP20_13820 [Gammaproteobacteria bacterium]
MLMDTKGFFRGRRKNFKQEKILGYDESKKL